MTRPNFFVLGAPKAGTTSLYEGCRRHPQVAVSRPKEPHFFDANYDRGIEWYRSQCFPEAAPAVGEATPHYLFVPYVARRIARHCPDAKLIVLLRDPVGRAYSDWWMYWTRATEPLPFEAAIEENIHRLATGRRFRGEEAERRWRTYYRQTQSGEPGVIEHRPYVEMGYYDEQLARYRAHFADDQILVLFFEDFTSDPAATLRRVWRFLGLRADSSVPEGALERNEAMGGWTRRLYGAARRFGVEPLLHRLPRPVRQAAKRLSSRLDPRPSLPEPAARRLRNHYKPHVAQLEEMTGRTLSAWRP